MKRSVVLIEDNDDNREMLALLLEDLGFQVTTAATGREGVDAILHTRPDAALVDVGLPELDGYEVARRVRAAGGELFLVALTGFSGLEAREKARAAGFDLHLVKPVDPDRLAALLERGPAQAG